MIGKLLIIIFTLNTACSQIMLKQAVKIIGTPATIEDMPAYIIDAARSPWIWASLFLQLFSYVAWIVVLSREKLGVALAVSGSIFYIVMAIAAWMLYDESLTSPQWAGMACVVIGVVLLGFRPA